MPNGDFEKLKTLFEATMQEHAQDKIDFKKLKSMFEKAVFEYSQGQLEMKEAVGNIASEISLMRNSLKRCQARCHVLNDENKKVA
jgi:hypothetical protein